jgi:hypothetical protein
LAQDHSTRYRNSHFSMTGRIILWYYYLNFYTSTTLPRHTSSWN